MLGSHTIIVLRPPNADRHANVNWAAATRLVHTGCSVQSFGGDALGGGEATDFRDTVTSRRKLFDPNMDLRATDRVEFDGKTYTVEGEPQPWDFPPLSHVYAILTRVEG